MCLSTLTLPNNSKSGFQHIGLTKTVPCGKCFDCLSQYQNEWYARAVFQYQDTVLNQGGLCSFITLTYADKYLPRYTDTFTNTQGKQVNFDVPCFNQWHIQRFIKYIKRYCENYLSYTKEQIKEIKYIICSEFGTHSTKRSHYHGLLFFPTELSRYTLEQVLTYSWSVCDEADNGKTINEQNREPLGWFSFGSGGYKVIGYSALKYTMKYTTKDVNGYNDIHNLQSYINASPSHYERIKKFLPFHLQSQGFGIYGTQKLRLDEILSGQFIDPLKPKNISLRNPVNYIPVPKYILRKLFFTKPLIENNYKCGFEQHTELFYRLNDDLLRSRCDRIEKKYNDMLQSFDAFNQTFANVSELYDLESYYEAFKEIIIDKNKIADYVVYSSLKQFSCITPYLIKNPFDLLCQFTKEKAREHDQLVNNVDLTIPVTEIKEFPKGKKHIYKYESLFGTSFSDYELPLYDDHLIDEYEYIDDYLIHIEIPKISRGKNKGKSKRTSRKATYLKLHPETAQNSQFQWSCIPEFKDFDVIDDIFSSLISHSKNMTRYNNYQRWITDKKFQDSYNYKKYV